MRATWLRIAAFVLLFGLMYSALASYWSAGLSHWIIDVATVEPAAWLARHLTGSSNIVAAGSRLASPEGSVNILFGCEGTDVLMLLIAAMCLAPISWRRRLLGAILGTGIVFAVNQGRVLALFFVIRSHPSWFGPIHGLVAPVTVIVVVIAFFAAWLDWMAPAAARGDAPA